jgi:hypothetical protein
VAVEYGDSRISRLRIAVKEYLLLLQKLGKGVRVRGKEAQE